MTKGGTPAVVNSQGKISEIFYTDCANQNHKPFGSKLIFSALCGIQVSPQPKTSPGFLLRTKEDYA